MPKFAKTLRARELRQHETYTEGLAWNLLRGGRLLGLKFRRQFVFRGFILDFYCYKHNLAVEVDGGIHEHLKSYDEARQAILERHGLRFVRISANELETSPEKLLDMIRAVIESSTTASSHPSSPSRSEQVERGRG
jgi:very-short-patch-repair endonuclease